MKVFQIRQSIECAICLTLISKSAQARCELHVSNIPVECDSSQCKHTCDNGVIGYKIVDCAVDRSKWPVIIPHIDKVEQTIENGHQEVCERQVYQKVVGRRPHSFVP